MITRARELPLSVRPGQFDADSLFNYPSLIMTLRHLKLIATVTPVLALIAIEVARYYVIGALSLWQRLTLDAVAVAAIIIFSAIIFRFVGGMQDTVERRNRELLALHNAGLDVASDLSLATVLDKVVEQATNLVGARYGALSVTDREGNIKQFITTGITPEERQRIGPLPVGHGVLGEVLREGQHLRLANLADHPRSVGFPPNHPVMRTLLAVPITCKSPFLANIYLSEKLDGKLFTTDDHETLQRFAVQAGIAIDNAHLHSQAAEIATALERLRIAHEMHDGLAQVLGYVNTKVQAAKQYLRSGRTDDAATQLDELAVSARQAYSDVREAIVGLRTLPGTDRSLAEVLDEFLEQWRQQSGVSTELHLEDDLRLQASVELQIVRIIQESLTNVRKHARATIARVEVHRSGDQLVLNISDNGTGFDEAKRTRGEFPRFGLTTMRERAASIGGTLRIDSAPGAGTAVRFTMPLSAAVVS